MPEWLEGFLSNPAVQAGAAPFIAGLVVALALRPLRLSGLAVTAAFAACMYLVSGIQFSPLTATRKLLVLALAAPVIGILVDFAFKPTRLGSALIAIAAALGAWWAFGPVLQQRPGMEAWLGIASVAVATAFAVGFSQAALAGDGVRAGAAALAYGIGTGVAAIFSASIAYGSYGLALGAGAGAFLLPQMISGTKSFAGATFTLPAMLTSRDDDAGEDAVARRARPGARPARGAAARAATRAGMAAGGDILAVRLRRRRPRLLARLADLEEGA